MTQQVLIYDAARKALAEARSYDEVRDWEDKAAAIREYARRSRNRELEIDALEIRVRAQRRRGELLRELRASGVLAEGRKKLSSADDSSSRLTLADLDTTANESSLAQRIASIEPDAFERLAARCRAHLESDDKAHSFDVLRERDGPVNGARSVMGSRAEPDDSLDYFPTPPWATRALFKHVLPEIGADPEFFNAAWEPACGEGHIAEVLEEYFQVVAASDIFDYGYHESRVMDFLTSDETPGVGCDWIITNPPFGDNAEAFVLRALERADIGVAMFFRLQWLETIGRFERIFRPYPPAIIAQFAERVPLHKGRWEPDGSTATAYLWIVWLKDGSDKTRFFWIPPGCKDELTRDDDRARFTKHPVPHLSRNERMDAETGEIHDSLSESEPEAEPVRSIIDVGAGFASRPTEEADACASSSAALHASVDREAGEADGAPSAPEPSMRGGAEVARLAHNQEVEGANPSPATKDAGPLPAFLKREHEKAAA